MVERADGVASSADAGDQIIRIVPAFFFEQLGFDLLRDDRLEAGDHVGIGVRADRRTDQVEGFIGVFAPVLQRFVHGFLERLAAGFHRNDLGAEHLHFPYVEHLPLDVHRSHVHVALHAHQGADGSRRHAMLPGARLGDDAGLAHPAGQQDLSDGVVDLVGTGMVEVFALEVDLRPVTLGQTLGQIQG